MLRNSSNHKDIALKTHLRHAVHQRIARISLKPWQKNTLGILGYSTWVIASFFLAAFTVSFMLIGLIKLGVPYTELSEAVRSTIEAAAVFAVALLFAVWVPNKFVFHVSREHMGLTKPLTWFDLLAGPVGFIPFLILAVVTTAIASVLVPNFDPQQAQDVGFNGILTSGEYMLAFLTLVVIAPIAEEMLFRGFFYGGLRRSFGIILSSLLVSVVFGALHMQWNVGVNVFALSLVLCGLRELTGGIWAGVVLHMVKNAIAFYGLFIVHL
jgi:membrane protease YdiL (CAAX protease family)